MLPLTPFEEYMLLDYSESFPMDSLRLLRFSGVLDPRLFCDALDAVIAMHPLLRSIVKKIGRRYYWEETDIGTEAFFYSSEENYSDGYCGIYPIDLFQGTGFKAYFSSYDGGCCVLMQFHHSVSDGIGIMEFIGDVLIEYSNRVESKKVNPKIIKPRSVDASLLPLRGKSGLTFYKYFRYFLDIDATTRQLVFTRPTPLIEPAQKISVNGASADANETTSDGVFVPAVIADEFTPKETKQFFRKAKQLNVTVNDLLLQQFYLAMFDWRKKYVNDNKNPRMRISVPVNCRSEKHQGIPCSNTVSMVFLDRKPNNGKDPDKLLQEIHKEMEWIKRTEQQHVFLLALADSRWIPGSMEWNLKRKQCYATAVLSNLGRIFTSVQLPRNAEGKLEIFGCVLESVDACPPLRNGTQVCFSALTYADRLRLIMRYDSTALTEEQAKDLLQRMMTRKE